MPTVPFPGRQPGPTFVERVISSFRAQIGQPKTVKLDSDTLRQIIEGELDRDTKQEIDVRPAGSTQRARSIGPLQDMVFNEVHGGSFITQLTDLKPNEFLIFSYLFVAYTRTVALAAPNDALGMHFTDPGEGIVTVPFIKLGNDLQTDAVIVPPGITRTFPLGGNLFIQQFETGWGTVIGQFQIGTV